MPTRLRMWKLSGASSTIVTVVVANLTAETIVELAPVLSNKVSRRGFLILSGILDQRAPGVISHFVRKSFALARKKRSKGWTTLALVKNN